jgi:hypothetical protein
MNKLQEEAWITLLLCIPVFLICGGLAVGLAYVEAVPFIRLLVEFAFFAIFGGFIWLSPFISGKIRKGKKKVSFDERDQSIHKRAVMTAYVVLWLYFVAACVIPWWLAGPHGSVSANILPFILIGGLVSFTLVRSVTTLILYGWGGKGEKT